VFSQKLKQKIMQEAVQKKRFEIIDALRGFSLAGIVLVHMVENFVGAPTPENTMLATHQGMADSAVDIFIMLFLRGKFFAIFSFLFGLSFYIQMKNASDKGQTPGGSYLWRLILLFAIGYLHHLFYRGDILTIYAIMGIFLIPFHSIRNTRVLLVAGLLFLGLGRYLVFAITQGEALFTEEALTPDNPLIIGYFQLLQEGAIWDVFRSNATEGQLMKMDFQFGVFSRAYLTFGFFLMGMLTGRIRLFQDFMEHKKLVKNVLIWSGVLFVCSLALAILIFTGIGPEVTFDSWASMIALTAFDLNNLAMTFILLALFVLCYRSIRIRPYLDTFAPYGRTALTNYLLQSVAGTFIFYGWGLGLLGELRNIYTFGIAILLVMVQMALSKWWLKRFNYGPFEWIWRSLTYFKLFPLRRVPGGLVAGKEA